MSLAVALTVFVIVFGVELPDKTLVATLILTTRYRGRPVLLGVVAAFAVQVVIAVAFGSALSLLPGRVVAAGVALLFAVGAFLLLREGFGGADVEDDESALAERSRMSFWRISLTSFGVLFAAEWGDASQLAVAALAARYGDPVAVGLGAWLALALVATIAVLIGTKVAHRLPVHLIQRVAGVVFAVFAVVALIELVRG
ncbi:MAG: TMEM165/GDT1 family protein [Mycobacteriaceae bacterium]